MNEPKRIQPGPGQESVWDYPRPPRIEPVKKHLLIEYNGEVIAETRRGYRVLETSHPPTYCFPPDDVVRDFLVASDRISYCEWKGKARYYHLEVNGERLEDVAWYYPNPTPPFREIAGYVSFYPQPMDRCVVDGEIVIPQPGGFYGGWITSDIVGPFKGGAGTLSW